MTIIFLPASRLAHGETSQNLNSTYCTGKEEVGQKSGSSLVSPQSSNSLLETWVMVSEFL